MTLTGYDQLDMRPLDLERVEVLKGPQGTLYGQGSIAGTVKYVTAAPDATEFKAKAAFSLADVDGGESHKTRNARYLMFLLLKMNWPCA